MKQLLPFPEPENKVRLLTMSIAKRIAAARKDLKISKRKLSQLIGISHTAVIQWEKENGSSPDGENLLKCAKILKVTPEWLQFGEEKKQDILTPLSSILSNTIPLFDWTSFTEYLHNPSLTNIPHRLIGSLINSDSEKTYIAVKFEGRSMISSANDDRRNLNIIPGEIIVIELQAQPKDGNLIICKINGIPQLRLYEKSSPYILLTIFNETYPERTIRYNPEKTEIIGKVIQAIREF